MPGDRCSHEENRSKVCICCFKKGASMRRIVGEKLLADVRTFYIENYDPDEARLPCGICCRCRKLLEKVAKGSKSVDDLPDPYDFSQIVVQTVATRATDPTTCSCDICDVARANPVTIGSNAMPLAFPHGRPPTASDCRFVVSPRPITVCKRCYYPIGKGLYHPKPCTFADARANIIAKAEAVPRCRDLITSDTIKARAEACPGSSIKIGTRGADLTVPKPKPPSKAPRALFTNEPVPTQEVERMNVAANLTLSQSKKVLGFQRTWYGRNAIESGVMQHLRDSGKDLESFFSVTELKLDSSSKEEAERVDRSVIYCDDIEGLIDHVIEHRDVDEGDYMIKFGLDSGGGFLKVCLNIIRTSPLCPEKKRAKYSEGASRNEFLDSGVKKLLIIAIVEKVTESYYNLSQILKLIKIERVDFMCAFDLKLANIFFGIGSHSSKYPCTWCELSKDNFSDPKRKIKLRTLGMIRKNAKDYEAALRLHTLAKPLSAANWKSCTHQPLVDLPDETLVIDLLSVMELHIMLGVVNRLYDLVETILKDTNFCAKDWADVVGVRRPPLHGGEFNGPQCKRLLSSMEKLEKLFADAQVDGEKVIAALKAFSQVKTACFGNRLDEDYEDSIQRFEEAYRKLGINYTSKVHALVDHASSFLKRQNAKSADAAPRGLGHWSEQASESVHYDFGEIWKSGYKRELCHKDYGDQLLKCVVTYSSRHQ